MNNPLLDTSALPRFGDIAPEDVLPALKKLISEHRGKLAALLDDPNPQDFETLVTPLEEMNHELSRVWSPVRHLQSVLETADWREAYNAALPLLTQHSTELSQNSELQKAFERVSESLPANADDAKRSLVDQALRDFRLAGVALADDKKTEFRELMQELATAQANFDQNVQDSTDSWHLHTENDADIAGLPAQNTERARRDAEEQGVDGWWLTLDVPTYQAVMTHAESRKLRHAFYQAWSTRASDQSVDASFDNSENIARILQLRHKAARLVGFDSYAEYSLATKMAAGTADVTEFLRELAARARATAEAEFAEITTVASHELAAWDVAFYTEQLKQQKFFISNEELRQYFPISRVLSGLFGLTEKLYGVSIAKRSGVRKWHPNVDYFELRDGSGDLIGSFYVDLYARNGKRGGAWVDECVIRRNMNGENVLPVGYLVCNFSPLDSNDSSLLTHDDVVTLFHEFGHMLHHLLTRVDYPSIAGINGVPWDAVELPSQFMENFCWEKEALQLFARHYQTGEALPDKLFDKMIAAKNYQSALQMLRQLEFALFDLSLHHQPDLTTAEQIQTQRDQVRAEISVVKTPCNNRFQNGFSHIFAGGYAAGYYSYKWAEVLSADAFAAFEEEGIFNPETGNRFLQCVLEKGGSRPAMESFRCFRGREPEIDALLRHSGIS